MAESTTYEEERRLQADEDAWRRNLDYWRRNAPEIHVNYEQNAHVEPRALRTPWDSDTMGLPPLVNMQVIPRKKPLPKQGAFAENDWIGSLVSIALLAVPYVGGILSVAFGLGYSVVTIVEMKEWAKKMRAIPPSVFAPRYHPQAFTMPMPLDRAQYLVDHPWLAPLMVDGFVKEWNAGDIGNLDAAISTVLPTETLQSAFGDLPAQGQTGLGGGVSVPRGTSQRSGGSLPGLLLFAGAALLVVIITRKPERKRRIWLFG